MDDRVADLTLLAGLTALTMAQFVLPSPTALKQLDDPAELKEGLLIMSVLAVAIGIVVAKMADHHAPVVAAVVFVGLVAAIYGLQVLRYGVS